VLCKQGEARIRHGLVDRNRESVESGLSLCAEAGRLAERGSQGEFFAEKGRAKALLGMAALSTDSTAKAECISKSNEIIGEMEATTPYLKAFQHRLRGRLDGLAGEFDGSREQFKTAAKLFEQMRRGESDRQMSLQAIVCRIESARFQLQADPGQAEALASPLRELTDFIEPFGGLLGKARATINGLADEAREAAKRLPHDGEASRVFPALERLVTFLEG